MKAQYIILAVLGIPLIFCVFLFYRYVTSVDVPTGLKIVDCTNKVVKVNFKFPKGNYYHLMLVTDSTNAFSGQIRISDKTSPVIDFPIDSNRSESLNWLQGAGIPWCLSLTGDSVKTNGPPLYRFVHAKKYYTIEIDFDKEPPPSMAIWLYWLQASKDKGK